MHSAMRGSLGKQAAVFHGQGGHNETHKDDLLQYFRLVDASLETVLRESQAPLLLAGVDYLLPLPAPAPDTAVRLAEPQVATRDQKRRAAGPDAFDAIRRAAKRIAMSSVATSAPAPPAPAPSAPTPPLEHLIIWQ